MKCHQKNWDIIVINANFRTFVCFSRSSKTWGEKGANQHATPLSTYLQWFKFENVSCVSVLKCNVWNRILLEIFFWQYHFQGQMHKCPSTCGQTVMWCPNIRCVQRRFWYENASQIARNGTSCADSWRVFQPQQFFYSLCLMQFFHIRIFTFEFRWRGGGKTFDRGILPHGFPSAGAPLVTNIITYFYAYLRL